MGSFIDDFTFWALPWEWSEAQLSSAFMGEQGEYSFSVDNIILEDVASFNLEISYFRNGERVTQIEPNPAGMSFSITVGKEGEESASHVSFRATTYHYIPQRIRVRPRTS